jgi:hypothetical protein
MDLNALVQNASVTLVALGWKLAGAVALWLAGRWLIAFATRLVGQALDKQQFDVTLTRYAQTALKIGEAGFPAPMPASAVSGPFVGPALDTGNGRSAARHG